MIDNATFIKCPHKVHLIVKQMISSVSILNYIYILIVVGVFIFFKQKTAYEMRISDWSSDVCSSDLHTAGANDGNAQPTEGVGKLTPYQPAQRGRADDLQINKGCQHRCRHIPISLYLQQMP